ncbi:MAG: endolytic transglycosylase MltG [Flavobacteriales bacterium]|nr:endolytic transglycosylase MltG [Flavobacteriales bacterium]
MRKRRRLAGWITLIAFALLGWKGYQYFQYLYKPNAWVEGKDVRVIYIPTGSDFDDVREALTKAGVISNVKAFEWVADVKKYPSRVKPGRYKIRRGMSNEAIVNMLRSGDQEAVRVRFDHIHVPEELAGILGRELEPDSVEFLRMLKSDDGLAEHGIGWKWTFYMCLPNTYDFFWNTNPEKFRAVMIHHYKKYWTDERVARASAIGLSVKEVTTLASIVEMEAWRTDERPTVAGVYMNRLRIGMRLQADPTLIFSVGDFSIRRVTKKHMLAESPYNTYRYAGLPPGPICLPSSSSIESVLHYEKHDYIYFCASDDLTGYHKFATTFQQHQQNARRYQEALNRNNVH